MTRGQDPEAIGALGGDDATLAVIAHGLLNSVSAIQMGAHALREGWERMTEKQRSDVLGVVADQAAHVRGVLQDMIRGLPPEVIQVLNELGREPAPGA